MAMRSHIRYYKTKFRFLLDHMLLVRQLVCIESCGGDNGRSDRDEEVCPSSPKEERHMTMAIFLPASVDSCGGGNGISSKKGGMPLLLLRRRAKCQIIPTGPRHIYIYM